MEVRRFRADFPTWNKTRGKDFLFLLNTSQKWPEVGEGFSVDVVRTKEDNVGVMLTPLKLADVAPDFTQSRIKFAAFVKADIDACYIPQWKYLVLNVIEARNDPDLQSVWQHLAQRLGANYSRSSDLLLVQRFLGLFFQEVPPEPPNLNHFYRPTLEQQDTWQQLCGSITQGRHRPEVTLQKIREVCSSAVHYPVLFGVAQTIDFSNRDEKCLQPKESALASFVNAHVRNTFKNKRELLCWAHPSRFYQGTPVMAASLPQDLQQEEYDHFLVLLVPPDGQSRWDVAGTLRPEIRQQRLVVFLFLNERAIERTCVMDQLAVAQGLPQGQSLQFGKKAARVIVRDLHAKHGHIAPFRVISGGDSPSQLASESKITFAQCGAFYDGYVVHADERYVYLEPQFRRDHLVLFPYAALNSSQLPSSEQLVRLTYSNQALVQWADIAQR